MVGHSPDGWQLPAKWNAFLDPSNDRRVWLRYKQCRALAWKVSRGVANGLKVSRSEAFRAVQLVLLRARLYEYHIKGPWMTMLVNAIEQLPTVDWDLLDDDYDGYDGEPREGVNSEDMANAGIGHRGSYDAPLKIWNACVPSEVITQIQNWKAEMSTQSTSSSNPPTSDDAVHRCSSVGSVLRSPRRTQRAQRVSW